MPLAFFQVTMFLVPPADFMSLEHEGNLICQHLYLDLLLVEFPPGFFVIRLSLVVRCNSRLFLLLSGLKRFIGLDTPAFKNAKRGEYF